MITVYCIMSCIKGEPPEPRSINGEVAWTTREQAEEKLERYCEHYGYDPDDFITRPFKLGESAQ